MASNNTDWNLYVVNRLFGLRNRNLVKSQSFSSNLTCRNAFSISVGIANLFMQNRINAWQVVKLAAEAVIDDSDWRSHRILLYTVMWIVVNSSVRHFRGVSFLNISSIFLDPWWFLHISWIHSHLCSVGIQIFCSLFDWCSWTVVYVRVSMAVSQYSVHLCGVVLVILYVRPGSLCTSYSIPMDSSPRMVPDLSGLGANNSKLSIRLSWEADDVTGTGPDKKYPILDLKAVVPLPCTTLFCRTLQRKSEPIKSDVRHWLLSNGMRQFQTSQVRQGFHILMGGSWWYGYSRYDQNVFWDSATIVCYQVYCCSIQLDHSQWWHQMTLDW